MSHKVGCGIGAFNVIFFMQERQMKMYSDKERKTEYEKKKERNIISVRKKRKLVGGVMWPPDAR